MSKATKKKRKARGSEHGLTPRQTKELAALAALPDHKIDTSDIPQLPDGAWKDAIRGGFYRAPVFEKNAK
jgi:hypothetical protein